ncbi:MAG: acyloxyacyl hydrolase, partial [Ignavibacterium sp.]
MIAVYSAIEIHITLLLFVLLTLVDSVAQDNSTQTLSQTKETQVVNHNATNYVSPLVIQLNYQYGFLIPHADEVFNVAGKHPQGLKLYFGWQLNSTEVWDDCNCFPRLGFFLEYFKTDFEEVLGRGYSLAGSFTYFFGIPSTYNFIIQGEGGLTYLTKPHDEINHPENFSYSTHWNYILSVGLGLNVRTSRHTELQFLVNMNHKSNAALLEPNGGVNYVALNLAAGYIPKPVEFAPMMHPDPYLTTEKKKRWDFTLFGGISSMPYPKPGQAPMYGINIVRSWQVARILALTGGAELEVNGRAKKLMEQYFTNDDKSHLRGSLQFGVEFLMGRTIFSVQLGVYVYREFVEKDDIYQRYNLFYRIFDPFYV